jgi:ABC-type sugar transport system, periplasmic component
MKKRTLLRNFLMVFMVLCLLFSVSCATPETAEKDDRYTIYVILRIEGDSYWDNIARGSKIAGEDTGHEVICSSPTDFDAAAQIAILQDAIAQKPDAICITPIENDACEPLLKQAMDQGIVIITSEGRGMENHDWDISAVNTPNYGKHAMDVLAEGMGEEGEFILMTGNLTNTGQMSRLEAMKERWEEAYPNMTMATDIVAPTSQTADAALSFFKELLVTYPNLKGIYAHESTAQASLAVEEAGKIGQVTVVGYSMPDEAGQYLENGSMYRSIVASPVSRGSAQVILAIKCIEGVEIVNGIDLGYMGFDAIVVDTELKEVTGNSFVDITKDNYKEYDF